MQEGVIDPFKALACDADFDNPPCIAPEILADLRKQKKTVFGAIGKYQHEDAEDCHLGYTSAITCLVREGGIRHIVQGSMAHFFKPASVAVAEDGFAPDNFDCDKFVETIKTQLNHKEYDEPWTLLMMNNLKRTLPQRICTVADMQHALGEYSQYFMEKPLKRHIVYFFVGPDGAFDDSSEYSSEGNADAVLDAGFEVGEYEDEISGEEWEEELDTGDEVDVSGNITPSTQSHRQKASPFASLSTMLKSSRLTAGKPVASTAPEPSQSGSQLSTTSKFHIPDWMSELSKGGLTRRRAQTPALDTELGNGSSNTTEVFEHDGVALEEDAAYSSPKVVVLGQTADALPQQIGILPTLDTDAGKGEVVEGEMDVIIPTAPSPTEEEWRLCCSLLKLNPEEHKIPTAYSIKIPQSDIHVTPAQFYTVYWMLTSRSARNIHGGFLADVPGSGKTFIGVAYFILKRLIAYSKGEVEREWDITDFEAKKKGGKASPKRHSPRNVTGNTPCICGGNLGIECYANPEGVTRRVGDIMARGVSLILAGQAVIDSWQTALDGAALERKYFQPVVFHTDVIKRLEPPPDLVKKFKMKVAPRATESLHNKDWKPQASELDYDYDMEDEPSKQPERYIILAGHTSNKLQEAFQIPFSFATSGGGRERKTTYACPVGVQLVDEFHSVRTAKDHAVAIARDHKHMWGKNFDFWALTGTPLPKDLMDLDTAVGIIQRDEWESPEHRQHSTRLASLEELHKAYLAVVSAKSSHMDLVTFKDMATKFFDGGLITRHTEESTFFGKPIFDFQQVKPRMVTHYTPDRLIEPVQNVSDMVKTTVQVHVGEDNWAQAVRCIQPYRELLEVDFLSTFPSAATLMLKNEVDFTAQGMKEEILKAKDHNINNVPLFEEVLDEVIEDSPKLGTILRIIDAMCADKQPRRRLPKPKLSAPDKVIDPTMKKMVIICPRLAEAVFVTLAIRKHRPDVRSTCYHQHLLASTKKAIETNFQSLESDSVRIFVASFGDGGTGINLFNANYQIQTGPLRLKSLENQSFGRTNRKGQQLPLQHYILTTEDNPLDRIVVATQAGKKIKSDMDPFNMRKELEFE